MPPLAIVCRQDQLLAAAVVLSCVPRGSTALLLVQEREPHDHDEYRRRYAVFREHFERRNELIGGGIGWAEAGTDRQNSLLALQLAVDRALIELGPYRSWYGHQRGLRSLAMRVAPTEALLLYPQARAALVLKGIAHEELIDERSQSLLPDATALVDLCLGDAATADQWLDAAWALLRPGEALAAAGTPFDPGDPASCLAALRTSLDNGLPLRPQAGVLQPPLGTTTARPRVHCAALQAEGAATEVVLIEAAVEADLLLGVLYAASRGLGVISYAQPVRTEIDAALEAVEQQRQTASKRVDTLLERGIDPQGVAEPDQVKLIGTLRRWLSGQRTDALAGVRKAVTAAIPAELPGLVGNAAVTVLTIGLPYRFLSRPDAGGSDWCDKVIGHVCGDRALLLLNVLHPRKLGTAGTFDMLFDPGFFEATEETRHVLNALEGRRSYAVVFDDQAGSTSSLLTLTAHLPVELIYFNTHGSRDGILLADHLLPSFKLAQWLTLPSRPVVFNSSCLSWLGVGTEFVRCGAQGYIGTLWSVAADDAAQLAGTAVRRMVREAEACAAAIVESGVDPATSMAYLFIGTASQRLQGAEQAESAPADRARSHATALLWAARDALDSHGQLRRDDHRRPTLDKLLVEADRVIVDMLELDATSPDSLELLLLRVTVLHQFPAAETAERLGELLDDLEARVAALPASDPLRWRVARERAEWLEEQGETHRALEHLEAVTLPDEPADRIAAQVELQRSDLHKKTGNSQAAYDAAKRSLAIHERIDRAGKSDESRFGMMSSLGHFVQAALRLPDRHGEALAAAERGLALAIERHHDAERITFELDLARIHHIRGDLDKAIPFARSALKLARLTFNNVAELAAAGSLTNLLMANGQLAEAAKLAAEGMRQAQELRRWTSAADFAMNLARIEADRGDRDRGFEMCLQAATVYSRAGQAERLKALFEWVHSLAQQDAANDSGLRVVELACVVAAQGEQQGLHWQVAIEGARALVQWAQGRNARPPNDVLMRLMTRALPAPDASGKRGDPSPPAVFLLNVAHMLSECVAGNAPSARAAAAALDRMAGSTDFSVVSEAILARWHASTAASASEPGGRQAI